MLAIFLWPDLVEKVHARVGNPPWFDKHFPPMSKYDQDNLRMLVLEIARHPRVVG